jgi:hypothetical protein
MNVSGPHTAGATAVIAVRKYGRRGGAMSAVVAVMIGRPGVA